MHNVTLKYLADLYRGHMGQKKFADMVGLNMRNFYQFLSYLSIYCSGMLLVLPQLS